MCTDLEYITYILKMIGSSRIQALKYIIGYETAKVKQLEVT